MISDSLAGLSDDNGDPVQLTRHFGHPKRTEVYIHTRNIGIAGQQTLHVAGFHAYNVLLYLLDIEFRPNFGCRGHGHLGTGVGQTIDYEIGLIQPFAQDMLLFGVNLATDVAFNQCF
jgi:hypothetical protein